MRIQLNAKLAFAAAIVGIGFAGQAFAEDKFPSKDLTFVVHAAAGGASDRSSRALTAEMEKTLGKSIIVENRPGASGSIAFAHVAEQKADGYTIGFAPVEFAILGAAGYDFDTTQYTYLGQIMNSPVVIAVPANSPYKTLAELIEAGKTTDISVANSGAASAFNATALTLAGMTGAKLQPVPFDGGAPAVAAAIGGHVAAVTAGAGETVTPHTDGTLRVLAVFSEERHPRLPEVPTAKEQGFDLSFGSWGGVYGPAGIPDDIRKTLEEAVKQAASSESFAAAVTPAGILPVYKDGAAFEAFVASDAQRYADVLK